LKSFLHHTTITVVLLFLSVGAFAASFHVTEIISQRKAYGTTGTGKY
jgi:hypothetical protein